MQFPLKTKAGFPKAAREFLPRIDKNRWHSPPLGVALGLPSPSPHKWTDRRAYADVRTKLFRIDRLPDLLTNGATQGAPL